MKYVLYGSPQSLFTRKLQAALEFYPLEFEFRRKRGSGVEHKLELRSGTHQVPVLQTPEDWMIADTTPVIALLDARFPRYRLFPGGFDGFVVHLLEDIFDEWISRTMLHYRWRYPASAEIAADQLANGDPAVAAKIRSWGRRACRATGTETAKAGQDAEREYEFLLAAMESQLQATPYLLGSVPTALDCAVLGGLHAHILNDPDPAKLMRGYPRTNRWAMDNAQGATPYPEDETPQYDVTDFARQVLQRIAPQYRRFLLGNRNALSQDAKSFMATIYGDEISFLTREYPQTASQMLVDRMHCQLDQDDRRRAVELLETYDLVDCFADSQGSSTLTASQH
jgi:glutathione S-transferase